MRAAHRRRPQAFFAAHGLTIVVALLVVLWIALYAASNDQTHAGAFFGNCIGDWLGVLAIVVVTKYFREAHTPESRRASTRRGGPVTRALRAHSLTIVLVATWCIWIALYAGASPTSRSGQVYANITSEWGQLVGLVVLTKYLRERGSKDD
jgi:hypothetical protein